MRSSRGADFGRRKSDPQLEDAPCETLPDEIDVNVPAYFDGPDGEGLARGNLDWTDELRAWDGNFRDDGMMIVQDNRDVDITKFRTVLTEFLESRRRFRGLEGADPLTTSEAP